MTTKKESLLGIENITKSRIIANNTIEYKKGRVKFIRLHLTDVIEIHKNHIILNSGGWKSMTTKDRINSFQDLCYIFQSKGLWHVETKTGNESIFYDGMKILNTGRIIKPKQDDKKTKRLMKQIDSYCKKLAGLKTLPEPHAGDCFYCSMRKTNTSEMLGDVAKNKDHLIQHLKEKYIMGSLIINALKNSGYGNPLFVFKLDIRESIVLAVRKYFKRQLGIAR